MELGVGTGTHILLCKMTETCFAVLASLRDFSVEVNALVLYQHAARRETTSLKPIVAGLYKT